MCGAHELYLCTGSAPGFVQRITCNIGKTCTKGGCRNRFWQPRPTGKTYEDAQCSRNCSPECHLRSQGGQRSPSDSFHPIKAFPLRHQLVGILGGLNAPKNKVAFLETSGINFAAMIAAQSLLVSSSSHSSLKTVLLKEQRVILSQLLLLKLIISEHSR